MNMHRVKQKNEKNEKNIYLTILVKFIRIKLNIFISEDAGPTRLKIMIETCLNGCNSQKFSKNRFRHYRKNSVFLRRI